MSSSLIAATKTGKPDTFSVSGIIDDKPYTITWTAGVFSDPTGYVEMAIRLGEVVPIFGGPTPWIKPASTPAWVALVTALSVFERRDVRLDEAAQAIWVAIQDDHPGPEDGGIA